MAKARKPVVCKICGKRFKDKSGLAGHTRFKHPKGGPRVKAPKKPTRPTTEEYEEEKGRMEEEEVEPKIKHKISVNVDPSLSTLYNFLRSRGKISEEDYTLSDFINEYVIGHVKDHDNVEVVFMETPGKNSKVVVVEGKGSKKKKEEEKTPDEVLKDIDRTMARQVKMKVYDKFLNPPKEGKGGSTLKEMMEPLILMRLLPPNAQVHQTQHLNPEITTRVNKIESAIDKLAEQERMRAVTEPLQEEIRAIKELVKEGRGKPETVEVLRALKEAEGKSDVKIEKLRGDLEKERREKIIEELKDIKGRLAQAEAGGPWSEVKGAMEKIVASKIKEGVKSAKGETSTLSEVKELAETVLGALKEPLIKPVGQALASKVSEARLSQSIPQQPVQQIPVVQVPQEIPEQPIEVPEEISTIPLELEEINKAKKAKPK